MWLKHIDCRSNVLQHSWIWEMLLSIVLLQIKMTRTIEHSNSFYFFGSTLIIKLETQWLSMVIQFHFSSTQSKRKITVVSAGKHIAVISIKIIASRCFLIQKNKNFAIFYLMSLIWLGCFRTVTCANIIITICSGFPNSEEQVLLCSQYLRHIMALEHDCIISL